MKQAFSFRIARPSVFALASCAALIVVIGSGGFASFSARPLLILTLFITALAVIAHGCLARMAGRRPLISRRARRALVFVGFGPVFTAFTTWSVAAVMNGGNVDLYGIPMVYLFSLIVCLITAPVDGVLSYVMPIWLRAPLVAVVGAVVIVGVIFLLIVQSGIKSNGSVSLGTLILPLMVGAVAAGVSSLLSHDCRAAHS